MKTLALLAVFVAAICTTMFNWHFSYGLGRNEAESLTLAVFSVALDVTKWTMLVLAARAWFSLQSLAAILIWLAATSYSFIAAMGFNSTTRYQSLSEAQSYQTFQVELSQAKSSPLYQATHSCTHTTTKQHRQYCNDLKVLISKEPKKNYSPNPLNLPPELSAHYLAIYIALVCEIISALGFFAVLTPPKQLERRPTKWSFKWPNNQTSPPSSSNADNSKSKLENSDKPPSKNLRPMWRPAQPNSK